MKQYTNKDLEQLDKELSMYWDFDLAKSIIKHSPRSWIRRIMQNIPFLRKKFLVQTLYRVTKQKWYEEPFRQHNFPFDTMTIRGHFKLKDNWNINIEDRKYLKDGPLYADDGHTIIVPENEKWWNKSLIQILFLLAALLTIILAIKEFIL